MLSLIRRPIGPGGRRRGVTLVEMLVVVALVVLMMVILVQIFQSATGAMSASRTTQELDVTLRQVDSIIRSDLAGVTARMTPGMNDPKDKRGYFEYGENAFADAQGEDTDDWMAFTTRAPEGQVFSGRQWLAPPANQNIQPTTINSQVAEVIYFLRNGNLYRRVFLVAPERAKSFSDGNIGLGAYQTSIFGGQLKVSWLGMNDVSCRPGGFSFTTGGNPPTPLRPIPNDLGDLTNRENRAFRPRFLNDVNPQDGIPDDNNGDGVNDYYPTLYFDGVGHSYNGNDGHQIWAPNSRMNEAVGYQGTQRQSQSDPGATNLYAFPFIYPGMYSVPDVYRGNNNLGWIHEIYPYNDPKLGYMPNQNPLDIGDNLPAPSAQTWWGFPTWRETMAGLSSGGGVGWSDPYNFIYRTGTALQPTGLQPTPSTALPTDASHRVNLLPPVYLPSSATPPPYFDGSGSSSFVTAPIAAGSAQSHSPNAVWEDDLLLTNVRSFDIKVYDQNAPLYNIVSGGNFVNGPFSAGYQDLGYGSTGTSGSNGQGGYLGGPNGIGATAQSNVPWQTIDNQPQGFGHEGRMPPRTTDFRLHPRRYYYDASNNQHFDNIGDDQPGIIRLTRTFDTWSTDYINAPDTDINLNNYSPTSPALYPSFPPPYPSPLRGIQIQVRVVDPRGEKAKPITIRVDFTDKL